MKIGNFMKANKRVIVIFLIIEVILYICFYLSIKLEMTDEPNLSSSEIDINSREALEVVKNEHEKEMQRIGKNNDYGYIKEIKYTHNYEISDGVFCAIVKMNSGDCFLYEISESMDCRLQQHIQGALSYENMFNIYFDRRAYIYDIYNDYKDNISEWKVAKID